MYAAASNETVLLWTGLGLFMLFMAIILVVIATVSRAVSRNSDRSIDKPHSSTTPYPTRRDFPDAEE
jgi:Na+-transporting methylmalonyl-CoA/oxaloacetate decarboxylase gamma subunit